MTTLHYDESKDVLRVVYAPYGGQTSQVLKMNLMQDVIESSHLTSMPNFIKQAPLPEGVTEVKAIHK